MKIMKIKKVMSECRNYQGINLVCVDSELLSNIMLFRLRDALEKSFKKKKERFNKR